MQNQASRSWHSFVRLQTASFLLVLAIMLAGIPPISVGNAATFDYPDGGLLAAPSVNLARRPATPWLMAGEEVTYAIHATPQGLGTAAAEITFNYGRDLELVEVKPGPYLGDHSIPGPKIIDADQRQATYSWARVGLTPNPTVPGVLAYVTFRAQPGHPWNTWVRQQVSLVDGEFQVSQNYNSSFQLHVYERLPVPVGVLPSALFSPNAAQTGPHAAFGVRTHSPGTFQYKIEVSQDDFESTQYTFDQTVSQAGWDSQRYLGGTLAEFVAPEALKPGEYQWRAYALIEEVNQWTEASQVREFEVRGEPMGMTLVSPLIIAQFYPGQAQVARVAQIAVEGWGFTSSARAILAIPGTGNTPLEVEWINDTKVVVVVPDSIEPGLAELNLLGTDGQVQTAPLMILPPALFSTQTYLPRANQIIPGQDFTVQVVFSNLGTNDDSISVVAVNLPDAKRFQLMSIEGQDSAEVLDQDENLVLLAARDGSNARFKFRLPTELVSGPATAGAGAVPIGGLPIGTSLDFSFKPVVLGEVSQARWEQLQSEPVERRVQAVQEETAQRFRKIAQSFNQAPRQLLENQLPILLADSQSPAALELITRLTGNGLEMGRVLSAFFAVPNDRQSKIAREYRNFSGVWP